MRRFAALAAVPLLLCACQQEAEVPEPAETAAAPAPAVETTLDLQATGIAVPAQGGAGRSIFRSARPRAAAEASLGSVAGAVRERGENGECGAGPMQITQYEGLVLMFQQDKLVGWSATAPICRRSPAPKCSPIRR